MIDTVTILKIILSVCFATVSMMILFKLKPFQHLFQEFKLNRFAMILVSTYIIICVILLFNKTLDFYASVGLAYITTAGLYRHVKAHHPIKKFIPAVVLLILCIWLALMLMKPG
jgi:hypothetical protein